MRKGTLLFLAVAAAFIGSILSTDVQGQRGEQVQIPDGPGKELVSTTCTKCHGLNFITNSFGFTREEWPRLFGTMIALPKDQADTITNYLAMHFPEKPNIPKAVIMPGPVNVNIKVWTAPTLGQRPHDPLAARDGSIWWTGQYQSRLGRVDPKTGAMKEFPLDTPNSGPHGLVEDSSGNIWYTGINVQEVGKVDPKTGAVTEYKLNLEGARGPHTPIFDRKGMLFFTLQSGHVGRLNPANGEMKIVKSPSDPSYPYGVQVDSKNLLWYVDFRQPKLASMDAAIDGDQGVHAAARRRAPAPHRDYGGRQHLVYGLSARLPRPLRSEDRPVQGMDVARREGLAAVRHCNSWRHRVVQRVGREAEHARPIRHEDREIPDLGHPAGRPRHPEHDGDARG